MNETTAVLRRTIESVLYDADLSGLAADTSLKDLGANSIDRIDILIQAMNELSITCDLMEFKDARSFGEIAHVLHAKRA
ncbi:phosphopantetheine-binding protein [Brooklawnia cerclae]|uniref:Polyketide biosynthesis acyl carrier protein n=1 Tax=Brooklawnia cerclae TaxID=349934 RepID=A0ABX0SDY5_9ACTN|nr:phosphopantetheine-binding protein [Brooklawnia cerclae]NIH56597.1 polyketide biosynthesis acyl carrier protein [Brooklawnia cerclae]